MRNGELDDAYWMPGLQNSVAEMTESKKVRVKAKERHGDKKLETEQRKEKGKRQRIRDRAKER